MINNEWYNLDYLDPEPILRGLREMGSSEQLRELPYKVASLRTRELRIYGVARQAAIFCYLLGRVLDRKVLFALTEQSDYDCVAYYKNGDLSYFIPIQLKELVPENVNTRANVQELIDSLKKYADSKNLLVAVHINRSGTIRMSELHIPDLNIGALWFYGANDAQQEVWTIMGNILDKNAQYSEFRYPGA